VGHYQKSRKKKLAEMSIKFYLNNDLITLSEPDPMVTLLDFLRLDCKLTGTKEGCAEGDCGACTILIGSLNKEKKIDYKTANSCIMFLPSIANSHVISVEGLSSGPSGELHPVQESMVQESGAQCGFCTPGFIMSLYGLWMKGSNLSKQEIIDSLQGNLCRCTGYGPIIEAALKIGQQKGAIGNEQARYKGQWETKLKQLSVSKNQKEASLHKTFFLPKSVTELRSILANNKGATMVAGSTDVGLWVNKDFKNITPAIFLGKIKELKAVKIQKNRVIIGSMATYSDLQNVLPQYFPALGQYINQIGGDQIRNMGTIGGNIANGSPIGDLAPVLIALGTKMTLSSIVGSRKIDVEAFFKSYGCQDIKSDEFILNFEIPIPNRNDILLKVYKVSKRRYEDISTVSAAFYLQPNENGIPKVRFSFGGMAGIPKRALTLEKVFIEKLNSIDQNDIIMNSITSDFEPLTDCRGSSSFRLKLAQNLFKKFFLFFDRRMEFDIEREKVL